MPQMSPTTSPSVIRKEFAQIERGILGRSERLHGTHRESSINHICNCSEIPGLNRAIVALCRRFVIRSTSTYRRVGYTCRIYYARMARVQCECRGSGHPKGARNPRYALISPNDLGEVTRKFGGSFLCLKYASVHLVNAI